MNCLDCKHCGGIAPGSGHHRECDLWKNVLDEKEEVLSKLDEKEIFALALIARYKLYALMYANGGKLKSDVNGKRIFCNEHGMRSGWCDWPIQFDPCWIDECEFFEEK